MSGTVFVVVRIAMSVALVTFVGLAFWLLWRDLKTYTRVLASRQPRPITMLLDSQEIATPLRFTSSVITIGRDPASDFVLDDTAVSGQHARLSYRQSQWWLEDMHSTNGSYLNQQPVLEPVVIASGDQLRCGQAIITVWIGELTHG